MRKLLFSLFLISCHVNDDIESSSTAVESSTTSEENQCGPDESFISRIIDGDTIELLNGDKVRYILVNTPEKGECYYEEAFAFNKANLINKKIILRYDVECKDKYGRLLAYVTTDEGTEINSLLLIAGMARVLHIPPNGNERVSEFMNYENDARIKGEGLWGACK